MYLIKNKNVELLQDRYYLSKNEYLFKMKYVQIKNLKDLCGIFKNLINEFRKIRKEKREASKLIKLILSHKVFHISFVQYLYAGRQLSKKEVVAFMKEFEEANA